MISHQLFPEPPSALLLDSPDSAPEADEPPQWRRSCCLRSSEPDSAILTSDPRSDQQMLSVSAEGLHRSPSSLTGCSKIHNPGSHLGTEATWWANLTLTIVWLSSENQESISSSADLNLAHVFTCSADASGCAAAAGGSRRCVSAFLWSPACKP